MGKKEIQLYSGMAIFIGLFIMIFSAPFFINFLGYAILGTAIGFIVLMMGLYNFLKTII